MIKRAKSIVLATLMVVLAVAAARAGETYTVFAAASLRDVLEEAGRAYREESGNEVKLVFAASSVLARQIEAGAPADLYLSANEDWMDWLVEKGGAVAADVRVVAGNSLVVAVPPGAKPPEDLEELLGAGRFAMGDPTHVPAGRYAAEALENLGLWAVAQPHAVYCENVRVALEFVRRGEVGAGIVYGSDLAAASELVKAHEFPGDSHSPIRYAAAPVLSGDAGAVGFLDFLGGATGKVLFARYGFRPAP